MDLKELCEIEARGETCPEIEAFREQTKSLVESSGLSTLREQLAKMSQVHLPGQELITQHLKASDTLRESLFPFASSELQRIRDMMTQLEPFNNRVLREIQGLDGCLPSRFERNMQASFRNVVPYVDPLKSYDVTPVSTHLLNAKNLVQESVIEAADDLEESIRTEFGALLGQVKVLIEVNQKLFEHAVSNTQNGEVDRKRNRKVTIWLLVLTVATVLEQIGGLTIIGKWAIQFVGWVRHIP